MYYVLIYRIYLYSFAGNSMFLDANFHLILCKQMEAPNEGTVRW